MWMFNSMFAQQTTQTMIYNDGFLQNEKKEKRKKDEKCVFAI